MSLYRNTKVKVRSPDGDTDYFDTVVEVLQGDILAPFLFIICLDYVLRTSIDKNQRKRLRADPAKTITDADLETKKIKLSMRHSSFERG